MRSRRDGLRWVMATLAAASIATALVACDETAPAAGALATAAPTATAPVAGPTAPGATVRHLSPADFEVMLRQQGVVVIDVRTPAEFAAGHIASAVNIDVEAADFMTRIAGLDRTAAYAVYCHSGNRSAVATSYMASAGFARVVDLAGGISAWIASGRPTVGR
jgi:phage shock protein E